MGPVGRVRAVAVAAAVAALAAGCARALSGAAATPPAVAPTSASCASGQASVRWAPDHPTPPVLCVRVGTRVALSLYPPDLHKWRDPSTTDAAVVSIGPVGVNQEGVLAATLTARKAGHATVASSAVAMDSAPDPATVAWQLTITVVP
jgi:hypothetical protein